MIERHIQTRKSIIANLSVVTHVDDLLLLANPEKMEMSDARQIIDNLFINLQDETREHGEEKKRHEKTRKELDDERQKPFCAHDFQVLTHELQEEKKLHEKTRKELEAEREKTKNLENKRVALTHDMTGVHCRLQDLELDAQEKISNFGLKRLGEFDHGELQKIAEETRAEIHDISCQAVGMKTPKNENGLNKIEELLNNKNASFGRGKSSLGLFPVRRLPEKYF